MSIYICGRKPEKKQRFAKKNGSRSRIWAKQLRTGVGNKMEEINECFLGITDLKPFIFAPVK